MDSLHELTVFYSALQAQVNRQGVYTSRPWDLDGRLQTRWLHRRGAMSQKSFARVGKNTAREKEDQSSLGDTSLSLLQYHDRVKIKKGKIKLGSQLAPS